MVIKVYLIFFKKSELGSWKGNKIFGNSFFDNNCS
jgi:hypothetical protein